MTIYLRTENNNTILDLEVWRAKEGNIDVRGGVPIREYSKLLLANQDKAQLAIDGFDDVDNIRRWYWEVYNESYPNHSMNELMQEIRVVFLEPLCKQFNLSIVID
jgi:hypothetical protein